MKNFSVTKSVVNSGSAETMEDFNSLDEAKKYYDEIGAADFDNDTELIIFSIQENEFDNDDDLIESEEIESKILGTEGNSVAEFYEKNGQYFIK